MNKIIRDGRVAVLVSRGYGAGWYTWARSADAEAMVFCPRLVLAILKESEEDPMVVAKEEFPDEYYGGVEDLQVQWITQGQRFEIREYDGNESLHLFEPDDGIVA